MQIGQRVSYGGELCTVRYVGEVNGTKGEWIGVEWDDATRGKHNGEAGGKRYFECLSKELKSASFIRPSRPADNERTFTEALRFKYASEHIKISFQIGQPPPKAEKPIHFGTKEAEEVGFDKIAKKLADLHELRIVLLDGLCVHQPVHPALLEAWETAPTGVKSHIGTDIRDICPKITELDLSRNLFRSFNEVAAICEQLDHLKLLRLDGNRFNPIRISRTQLDHFKLIFSRVENLSLENTLLSWTDINSIANCFPALKTLTISSNEFTTLNGPMRLEFSPPLSTITLESNKFSSLSDITALADVTTLRQIVLKYNTVDSVTNSKLGVLFPHIADLDVSFNSIASWTFINDLSAAFPALTSLRISHNPIYIKLHSPAGRELTADDGYMLTIARLSKLKILNFSAITEKDRVNAESYYLSLIVQELSLAPESEAEKIKKSHPRWDELCAEYGEPDIKRQRDHVDPRSLAARLLTLDVELSAATAALFNCDVGSRTTIKNIPKRFNIYSVLGLVVRDLHQPHVVPGLGLSLITNDWEEVDDERVRRVVRLVPETRGIGTFVEDRKGHVRVEYEEPVTDLENYQHSTAASIFPGKLASWN